MTKNQGKKQAAQNLTKDACDYAENIISTVHEPMLILDQNLNILITSRSFYDVFKTSEEETVGRPLYEVKDRLFDIPELHQLFDTLLPQQGKVDSFYVEHDFPHIGRRLLHFNARKLNRSPENDEVILLAIEDITERRQAEETLRFKNVILSTQQEVSLDAILVVNEKGAIISYNRKFVELWQIPQKVIATGSDELALQSVMDKLASPQQFLDKVNYLYEHHHKTSRDEVALRDGRTLDRYSAPMFGEDKKYYGRVWYFRDISERKRAEQELLESGNYYRALTDNLPGITFRVFIREKNRMIFYNDMLEQITGYRAEELTAGEVCSIDSLILSEDHHKVVAAVKTAVKNSQPYEIEYRLCHKNGNILYCSEMGRPVNGPGGRTLYIDGVIFDITKRRQAENALARENELMTALLETSPDYVYFKDIESRFIRISKAQADRMGMKDPADAVGKTDFDFFMEGHAREAYKCEQEIIRTGRPLTNVEEEEAWPDGSITWVSTSKMPLKDSQGQIIGTFGISRDITQHRQAENALARENELMTALLSSVPDHIYFKDLESRFIRISKTQADWLGVKNPIEAVGKTDFDFFTEEHARRAYESEQEIIRTGSPYENIEEKETRPDGSIKWVLTSKLSLKDSQGQIIGTFGISRDITERRQTEEALYESEERYRTMVEHQGEGVAFVDPDERWTFTNPATEIIFGVPPGSLIDRKLKDFLTSDEFKRVQEQTSRRRTGEKSSYEIEIIRPDGEKRSLLITATPNFDAQGQFLGTFGVFRDITEAKRAQGALKQSEERYRQFLNSSDDMAFIKDNALRYQLVNNAMARFFDKQEDNIIGHSDQDLLPPEAAAQCLKSDYEALETGRVVISAEPIGERYYESRKFPLLMEDGRMGLGGIIRDITERRQAEEELRNERNLLRTLINIMPDSIYSKDLKGRKVLTNRIDMGYSGAKNEADLLGKTDFDIYPADLAAAFCADDQKVIQSGQPLLNREEIITRHDGKTQWLMTSKVPLRDSEGNVTGLVGVGRDITERKEAEEALKLEQQKLAQSNEKLKEFAHVVSHDLQEPLRMVISYMNLLSTRYSAQLDESAVEFINYAVDGAQRMRQLIQALLGLTRLDTQPQHLAPVEAEAILEVASRNLEVAVDENHAVITHDPLPRIIGDETRLVQLFQNIIGNAVKYHGEAPPVIHISSQTIGETVQFSVRDNGIGIDPRYHDRIFQLFQRLHSREEYEGTGIGLTMCRRIVEQHGGKIWLESAPEQGTTFFFTLSSEK